MVRDEGREAPTAARLGPLVKLLLWDHSRGSVAYDVAVLLVFLALLLVPGRFWGDPLWPAL